MTVAELIRALAQLPFDAEVKAGIAPNSSRKVKRDLRVLSVHNWRDVKRGSPDDVFIMLEREPKERP